MIETPPVPSVLPSALTCVTAFFRAAARSCAGVAPVGALDPVEVGGAADVPVLEPGADIVEVAADFVGRAVAPAVEFSVAPDDAELDGAEVDGATVDGATVDGAGAEDAEDSADFPEQPISTSDAVSAVSATEADTSWIRGQRTAYMMPDRTVQTRDVPIACRNARGLALVLG